MSAEKPPNQPNDAESPLSPEFDEEGIVQAAQTEIAEIIPPDPLAAVEETSLAMGESLEETKRKQELGEQHEVHLTRLGYVPKLFWLIVGWLVVASAFFSVCWLRFLRLHFVGESTDRADHFYHCQCSRLILCSREMALSRTVRERTKNQEPETQSIQRCRLTLLSVNEPAKNIFRYALRSKAIAVWILDDNLIIRVEF